MTNYVIHRADSRGVFQNDWLTSAHTFNFGEYYDAERTGFGNLRVINDDWVAPGKGFATHPHKNMEIISIALVGALAHKDSQGNEHIIHAGEIQVMSAGSGITHSEYNHSSVEQVNFLQIWIQPDSKQTEPSYQQMRYHESDFQNQVAWLVKPDSVNDAAALAIKQSAYLGLLDLSAQSQQGVSVEAGYHLYVFVLSGCVVIDDKETLQQRDGMAMSDIDAQAIQLSTSEDSRLLLIKLKA